MDDLTDVREQLQSVSERLGDHIMNLLQEAVLSGADKRPQTERLVSRARNAVDKAIALLDRVEQIGPEHDR